VKIINLIRDKFSSYIGYFALSDLLFFIAFLLIAIISIMIRIVPYMINSFFFDLGFDTGIYEQLLHCYNSSEKWHPFLGNSDPLLPYQWYFNRLEPNYFIVLSVFYNIANQDMHQLFRYYIPAWLGVATIFVVFFASSELSKSKFVALLSAIFASISYIQVNAVIESYHRQIIATLMIILCLIYLDRCRKKKSWKNVVLSSLFASAAIMYHISSILLIFVAYFIFTIVAKKNKTKNFSCIKHLLVSGVFICILSLPTWMPRLDYLIDVVYNTVETSLWRIENMPTGSGLWAGGGAIPSFLRDYPHPLIGYCHLFFSFVLFSIVGYFALWKKQNFYYMIPLFSIFLWFYIGMWFFFGNRLMLFLDLLLCIIAPIGILYIQRKIPIRYRKNTRLLISLMLCILIILPMLTVTYNQQVTIKPYISQNREAIEWIKEEISSEKTVIFAPDYLSANLIQLGYLMAVWDFSLSNSTYHPMTIAEEFMVNAPSNLTFLREFFSEHPDYKEKEIYVLWGTWDLDRPLVMTKKLIPVDEYASSPYFRCVYYGYAEILYIYKYVGPTDF